jgi:hypothetical protein
MTSQDVPPGWVDEDGLWWCVAGGSAAIRPEWFRTLLEVMSAADRVAALRQAGLVVEADERASTGWISARQPGGLWLAGESSLLTAALCYWEDWNSELASSPSWHARQRAAFDRAYGAVRAVGVAALGEPTLQGRDRDELAHRWSAWRVRDVVLAVYQAVADVQFGLSIQMDARRHPAEAPLESPVSFVDWMWNVS